MAPNPTGISVHLKWRRRPTHPGTALLRVVVVVDRLVAGQELKVNQALLARNGRTQLVMQPDGNLVLYRTDSRRALWASNTYRRPVVRAVMQGDGNFVCYDSSGRPYWASGTWRYPGSWLILQDDGNLCIYGPDGRYRWGTGTPQNWDMSRFRVEIKTADEAGAGTDSNIFIRMYGEARQSDEIRLNGLISRNAFERNSTEDVIVPNVPYLGRIVKVCVRSDTMYFASDWRLSWIKVTPLEPPLPASTFHYDSWIEDTSDKIKLEDEWPWRVSLTDELSETSTRQMIALVNLLDSDQVIQQEFTVNYELQQQVTVSTEVTNAQKLASKVSWESPSVLGGKLNAEVAAELSESAKKQQIDQATQKLNTQDKRTLTFPARKLTLIQTDWTELWRKALATIGSTAVGIRWIAATPSSPSWTVASFATGEEIPEPFADFLRIKYPQLAERFVLPPRRPKSGKWYSLTAKHSGKCLEVGGGSMSNGAGVNQWDWCALPHQMWQFVEVAPEVYELRVRHSGKSLDVRGQSVENGARIQQYTWWGGGNQQWRLSPQADGSFALRAVHSGKVLDVGAASQHNGGELCQWQWCDAENQKWLLAERGTV